MLPLLLGLLPTLLASSAATTGQPTTEREVNSLRGFLIGRRRLGGVCEWGSSRSGAYTAEADCTQNTQITISGPNTLVLSGGRQDASNLVKVTRSGGSANLKRFFKIVDGGRLELSWLHFKIDGKKKKLFVHV